MAGDGDVAAGLLLAAGVLTLFYCPNISIQL